MDNPKLPILETVLESYRILFRNFGVYVKLIWIPFLAFTALYLIEYAPYEFDYSSDQPSFSGILPLLVILLAIFAAFSLVPPMTAWHRLIILGPNGENSRVQFSFQKEELGYIGDGVLLALFFIPVFYLMQTAATHILSPVFDFGPWEDPSIARFFLEFIVSPIA